MSVEKKVSYLKGLAEGLNISADTPEGKLLLAIVDTLQEIGDEIEGIDEELVQLNDYVEELDNDLMEVEEDLYEDDDEDDEWCDGDCDCCDEDCEYRDEDCECCDDECDEDFSYEEYEGPKCHEFVSFSGEFAPDELVCPNCGEKLEPVKEKE